jgi:hypothetical protein
MNRIFSAFFCIALLSLGGCIPVDDFGAYWDKGTADSALTGTWEDIPEAGEKAKKDGGVAIVCAETACTLDTLDAEEKKKADYKPSTLRTLDLGGVYQFLMVREEGKTSGDMIRYTVEDGVFRQHTPVPVKWEAFLKEKYPKAKNITRPACPPDNCSFDSIDIKTLDDETAEILSQIPDTAEYWVTSDRYRLRK